MTNTDSPLVRRYLKRLDAALARVPAEERRQIIDGVEEHVATALAELEEPTQVDVHDVLARLGDPETIAAEACDRLGVKRSRSEKLTTALLAIGAVVGLFDLAMVSTSQVGPIEFALLAVPVTALIVLAVALRLSAKACEPTPRARSRR